MSKSHPEEQCKQGRERKGVIFTPKRSAMKSLKPSRDEKNLDSILSVQAERSSQEEHSEERNICIEDQRGSVEQDDKGLSESRALVPEQVLSIFLLACISSDKAFHFFRATLKLALNFRPKAQTKSQHSFLL